MNIKKSITELIGKTPLLQLVNYENQHHLEAEVIAKLEYLNPASSVKDRTALSMIENFEEDETLKPGGTIVEVTSGNTGVGAAAIAATKGYKTKIYLPDNVSEERTQVARAYGAEVVPLTEIPNIEEAIENAGGDLVATIKEYIKPYFEEQNDGSVFLDQMSNRANFDVHYRTTGPEIWADTNGTVDIYVASVGTGGTISGAGTFLKEKKPNVKVVAVEPAWASVSSKDNPDVKEIMGTHRYSDLTGDAVPNNVDRHIIDEVIEVLTEDAYEAARDVAKSDGILVGISSGAAIWSAAQLAKRPENKGKRIVVVLPDTGLRYLSTDLFK